MLLLVHHIEVVKWQDKTMHCSLWVVPYACCVGPYCISEPIIAWWGHWCWYQGSSSLLLGITVQIFLCFNHPDKTMTVSDRENKKIRKKYEAHARSIVTALVWDVCFSKALWKCFLALYDFPCPGTTFARTYVEYNLGLIVIGQGV